MGETLLPYHTYVVTRTNGANMIAYVWQRRSLMTASRCIRHYTDNTPYYSEHSEVLLEDAERDYNRCRDPKKIPFR